MKKFFKNWSVIAMNMYVYCRRISFIVLYDKIVWSNYCKWSLKQWFLLDGHRGAVTSEPEVRFPMAKVYDNLFQVLIIRNDFIIISAIMLLKLIYSRAKYIFFCNAVKTIFKPYCSKSVIKNIILYFIIPRFESSSVCTCVRYTFPY